MEFFSTQWPESSGAKIIKNVGDCLIFCYPRTSDPSNKSAFNYVLECCITMIFLQIVVPPYEADWLI